MNDELPSRRSLDSLKKEAKRWLAALRVNAGDARTRLERALAAIPDNPTLRDVQHALAREHGFSGWTALKAAIAAATGANSQTGDDAIARYDDMADALFEAYRTGTPEAMERMYRYTWHRRSWSAFRSYLQLDLGKRPATPGDDVEITLDDARHLIAREHGFSNWKDLTAFSQASSNKPRLAAKPVRLADPDSPERSRIVASSRDWDEIIHLLAMHPSTVLQAEGQMTDELLADIAKMPNADQVTAIDLNGSKRLTDDGILHLARFPRLEDLDLSGTALTDRGLAVLRDLPSLKSIALWWTGVTDEGVQHLAHCREIERVKLGGTRTGDGALRALAGKQKLRNLMTGVFVTDAGLPMLHELPVFKTWHGGQVTMALTSYDSEPNNLALRGSFTDRGMQHLRGLDGLFGLNLDDSHLALTAAALAPVATLPNLGWLSVDAKDNWMPHVAAMPKLRFLGAQDTSTGDDGFVALSKSQSIEYIWGRRCHNLQRRGFRALAKMPALRGLSVSCLNVDDEGVADYRSHAGAVVDDGFARASHVRRLSFADEQWRRAARATAEAARGPCLGTADHARFGRCVSTKRERVPRRLNPVVLLARQSPREEVAPRNFRDEPWTIVGYLSTLYGRAREGRDMMVVN
jgi:hypothetical protein